MANKSSLAIELKEMSSYPSLEETKIAGAERRPNEANPSRPNSVPNLTPVVPISINPPLLSFVEEQRLKSQQNIAEERKDYPNLPIQQSRPSESLLSQRYTIPAQNMPLQRGVSFPPSTQFSTICCSGCRGIIQYPISAPVVYCVACRASTATKPLLNIHCTFCRTSSYYVADNTYVRCRCGTVYSITTA
jgi:LSD1 subclass zinc finger protein